MSAAPAVLAALLRASIEGALVIALVALLVRAVPSLPARLRCGLWWAACLKLAAGLLLVLAAGGGFELAVLPRAAAALPGFAAQAIDTAMPGPAESGTDLAAQTVRSAPAPVSSVAANPLGEEKGSDPEMARGSADPAQAEAARQPWWRPEATALTTALTALWLLGLAALAAATLAARGRLARRLRAAAPLTDAEALELVAATAERLAVAAPPVRVTGDDVPPQLAGALRPCLLLPRRALDAGRRRELALVVAHELAHLRRRDLLLGWVPALARGLFFFHPLAVHAVREYLLAREAACDAEVLRVLDASPRDYGRMLLGWSVALGGRRRPHGGPLAATLGHHRQLKRRLTMLETTSQHRGRLRPAIALLAAVPVLLAIAPVRLVAAPDADAAGGRATAAYAVSRRRRSRGDRRQRRVARRRRLVVVLAVIRVLPVPLDGTFRAGAPRRAGHRSAAAARAGRRAAIASPPWRRRAAVRRRRAVRGRGPATTASRWSTSPARAASASTARSTTPTTWTPCATATSRCCGSSATARSTWCATRPS